jgi:hypothetical protein
MRIITEGEQESILECIVEDLKAPLIKYLKHHGIQKYGLYAIGSFGLGEERIPVAGMSDIDLLLLADTRGNSFGYDFEDSVTNVAQDMAKKFNAGVKPYEFDGISHAYIRISEDVDIMHFLKKWGLDHIDIHVKTLFPDHRYSDYTTAKAIARIADYESMIFNNLYVLQQNGKLLFQSGNFTDVAAANLETVVLQKGLQQAYLNYVNTTIEYQKHRIEQKLSKLN